MKEPWKTIGDRALITQQLSFWAQVKECKAQRHQSRWDTICWTSLHVFLLVSDGSYHEWDAARYEVRALGKNLAKPPRSQRFSGQKKEKVAEITRFAKA